MDVLTAVKRRPVAIPLALLAAMAMVFISEVSYWRSVVTLNALGANAVARTQIQGLLQSALAAQAAQRSYLLTERRDYLVPYDRALQDLEDTFQSLQQRYRLHAQPDATLSQLHAVTGALLQQLAHTLRQHDARQPVTLDDSDEVQLRDIRLLSDRLLALESQSAEASQDDIYRTLLLSRIGVALLSAVSLLALVMYLRSSFALERERLAVQRIVQTEHDQLEVEVRQRTAQLTELTHHLQTAREDERSRLARNLHDDLGALLTSAKLDAARIRSRLMGLADQGVAPQLLDLLAHLVTTLNTSISLGRSIIEDLRPSALGTLGLVATLEILVHEYALNSGVVVHAELEPVSLDGNAELMVYRLVQEALTNSSKHALARQVWVSLGVRRGQIEVAVRDDGKGFDAARQPTSAYGLVGMRFRVEAEGGQLDVVSAPGQGTLIRVRLPLTDAEPA